MASQEDKLFAKIAIKNKLVTQEQVKKCFEVQKKLAALGKEKKLSEILKEIGFLKEEHLQKIQKAQEKTKKLEELLKIAKFVESQNLLSQKEINLCVEEIKESDFECSFWEILLQKTPLTQKQVEKLKEKYGLPKDKQDKQLVPSQPKTLLTIEGRRSLEFSETSENRDSLGTFSSKASTGLPTVKSEFDFDKYLQKKARSSRVLKGGIFFILFVLLGGSIYFFWDFQKTRNRIAQVRYLLSQEDFQKARKELEKVQPNLWISKEELNRLALEISLKKDLGNIEKRLEKGLFEWGIGELKKLKKKYPSKMEEINTLIQEYRFRQYFQKAQEAEREKKFHLAVQYLKEIHSLDPKKVEKKLKSIESKLQELGNQAFQQGRYLEAVKYWKIIQKYFNGSHFSKIQKSYYLHYFQKAHQIWKANPNQVKLVEENLKKAKDLGGKWAQNEEFQRLEEGLRKRKLFLKIRDQIMGEKKLEKKLKLYRHLKRLALSSEKRSIQKKIDFLAQKIDQLRRNQKKVELMVRAIQLLKKSKILNALKILKEAAKIASDDADIQQIITFASKLKGMVYIPAGHFWRGSPKPGEDPPKKIYLPAYFIDRYEVTNQDFMEFYKNKGYSLLRYWPGVADQLENFVDKDNNPGPGLWRTGTYPKGWDHIPVVKISWYEARAYAIFRGKQLPTELQWEKAARGPYLAEKPHGRIYPWGNSFDKRNLNGGRPYGKAENVGTTEGDKSFYGVYDMAGNVREWTRDSLNPYKGSSMKRFSLQSSKYKAVRGASWKVIPDRLANESRCSFRKGYFADQRLEDLGFRLVMEIPSGIKRIFQKYHSSSH